MELNIIINVHLVVCQVKFYQSQRFFINLDAFQLDSCEGFYPALLIFNSRPMENSEKKIG